MHTGNGPGTMWSLLTGDNEQEEQLWSTEEAVLRGATAGGEEQSVWECVAKLDLIKQMC